MRVMAQSNQHTKKATTNRGRWQHGHVACNMLQGTPHLWMPTSTLLYTPCKVE